MLIVSAVSDFLARLDDAALTPPACMPLGLEHVPVRDQHLALREKRHQVRRHQVAGPVKARLALLRVRVRPAGDGS